MSPQSAPPVALSIAGSDSGGGAGIQADLKTFAALEVYGASVVTALTAQNTREVRAVHDPGRAFLREQLEAVLDDLPVRAAKTGMLHLQETIEVVADVLARRRVENLVVDPVMVAKSGARLLREDAALALRERLLPLARVVTPNLPEAAVLLGRGEGEVLADPEGSCRALLELGPRAVVLKGGHAGGSYSEDLLLDGEASGGGAFLRLPGRRIDTPNLHGTGCTFSAALAALLARGLDLGEAALGAKDYVQRAIEGAREWKLGSGQGPLHHFHAWW